MSDVQAFIKETVTSNPVVLFMKGTVQFPQCGFSSRAVQILRQNGVTKLVTVNVLDDEEVRSGIKTYSQWPTIPSSTLMVSLLAGQILLAKWKKAAS